MQFTSLLLRRVRDKWFPKWNKWIINNVRQLLLSIHCAKKVQFKFHPQFTKFFWWDWPRGIILQWTRTMTSLLQSWTDMGIGHYVHVLQPLESRERGWKGRSSRVEHLCADCQAEGLQHSRQSRQEKCYPN